MANAVLSSDMDAFLTTANDAAARTELGLGTMATQAASTVAITGGAAAGLTVLGLRSTGAAFDLKLANAEVLTADRTLTFNVGNADKTLTIPASGTVAILGIANIFTVNGAASAPAMSVTGTVFTGGTSTTTKPLFLIEPAGTTSTGWSPDGTMFGVNAASGFVGRLADLQLNGVSAFNVRYDGAIQCAPTTSFPLILAGPYGVSSFLQLGNLGLQADCDLRSKTAFIADDGASFTVSNTAGQFIISNVGFAYTSSGVARISDGGSGRATLDAAAYQVGGVAGVSGTATAASTVTVVNGIITNIA